MKYEFYVALLEAIYSSSWVTSTPVLAPEKEVNTSAGMYVNPMALGIVMTPAGTPEPFFQ